MHAQAATVIDYNKPHIDCEEIFPLYGTKFRPLRGVLVLFSPRMLVPKFRLSKQFWKAIRSSPLSVCNTELITS